MSTIKTVPMFQTTDGQTHTSRLSAELHDLGLKIRKQLIEAGFSDEGMLKRMCLEMAKNSDAYAKIFCDGRRKMANARLSEKTKTVKA